MNEYEIETLDSKTGFTEDVFLDEEFLLLPRGIALPQTIKKFLFDWSFNKVVTEGEPQEADAPKAAAFLSSSKTPINQTQTPAASSKTPAAPPSPEKIAQCQKIYDDYCRFIESVFTDFATKKELDYMDLSIAVQRLCLHVKGNTQIMLRLRPQTGNNPLDDIIRHSIRSAVLAIAIGVHLNLTDRHIVDLGLAALIHEIGKLRVPQQLYTGNRQLTDPERELLYTHPRLGAEILAANNFPKLIVTGVFHHREREDGSGYPQHIADGNISTYGKIIAASCAFETISSPRIAKNKEEAAKEMVAFLGNANHRFDPRVITALKISQRGR